MPFPDQIKLQVKKKSNFKCCMCNALIVDVHHIIPESEGGPNTIDNAAPLCGGCHRSYGNNPDHRKIIKQMRDHWYEICERQNNTIPPEYITINEKIDGMRGDINMVKEVLITHFSTGLKSLENAKSFDDISATTSTLWSGVTTPAPTTDAPEENE